MHAFHQWALGFSGCDGGDLGTASEPSIWVCGIEWGGGHDKEGLIKSLSNDVSQPAGGYDKFEENLSYIFNWQILKLLSAFHGQKVEEYKAFGANAQPFVQGKKGYFKMNLFPIGFKNTGHQLWQSAFAEITGFENKYEYMQWCQLHRFPQMRQWSSIYKPKLIICLGKTYINDFSRAFFDEGKSLNREFIDNRELNWGFNNDGSLIVVLPFMVNRNGLVKNVSIQKFGARIVEIAELDLTTLAQADTLNS